MTYSKELKKSVAVARYSNFGMRNPSHSTMCDTPHMLKNDFSNDAAPVLLGFCGCARYFIFLCSFLLQLFLCSVFHDTRWIRSSMPWPTALISRCVLAALPLQLVCHCTVHAPCRFSIAACLPLSLHNAALPLQPACHCPRNMPIKCDVMPIKSDVMPIK